MHITFILAIIMAVVACGSLIVTIVAPNYPTWKWATPMTATGVSVFAAFILTMVGIAVTQDTYNEETNKICAASGGVVTKDNQCFKDNHPIEFSKGVWRR